MMNLGVLNALKDSVAFLNFVFVIQAETLLTVRQFKQAQLRRGAELSAPGPLYLGREACN